MEKPTIALKDKILEVTERVQVIKSNPFLSIEEHVDARLLISSTNESMKNPPMIMVIDPESMGKDFDSLASSLTEGMVRFADGVSVYPIQFNGKSNMPEIRWIQV